jgi:two-component system nitrogen regulation response regulator NtrX
MHEEAQAKVLRAVEESRFQRVGGTEVREVDVRIVAATNRDLSKPEAGFRQDLFFRLNVVPIHLPPLRERKGDVDLLIDHFMAGLALRLKVPPKEVTPEARALLREHSWPGNVRELRNLIERLLILVSGPTIAPGDLPLLPGHAAGPGLEAELLSCADFQDFKSRAEGMFLQHKLRENRYNVSKTAESLGMQRSNLYKKISKYGLRTQPED